MNFVKRKIAFILSIVLGSSPALPPAARALHPVVVSPTLFSCTALSLRALTLFGGLRPTSESSAAFRGAKRGLSQAGRTWQWPIAIDVVELDAGMGGRWRWPVPRLQAFFLKAQGPAGVGHQLPERRPPIDGLRIQFTRTFAQTIAQMPAHQSERISNQLYSVLQGLASFQPDGRGSPGKHFHGELAGLAEFKWFHQDRPIFRFNPWTREMLIIHYLPRSLNAQSNSAFDQAVMDAIGDVLDPGVEADAAHLRDLDEWLFNEPLDPLITPEELSHFSKIIYPIIFQPIDRATSLSEAIRAMELALHPANGLSDEFAFEWGFKEMQQVVAGQSVEEAVRLWVGTEDSGAKDLAQELLLKWSVDARPRLLRLIAQELEESDPDFVAIGVVYYMIAGADLQGDIQKQIERWAVEKLHRDNQAVVESALDILQAEEFSSIGPSGAVFSSPVISERLQQISTGETAGSPDRRKVRTGPKGPSTTSPVRPLPKKKNGKPPAEEPAVEPVVSPRPTPSAFRRPSPSFNPVHFFWASVALAALMMGMYTWAEAEAIKEVARNSLLIQKFSPQARRAFPALHYSEGMGLEPHRQRIREKLIQLRHRLEMGQTLLMHPEDPRWTGLLKDMPLPEPREMATLLERFHVRGTEASAQRLSVFQPHIAHEGEAKKDKPHNPTLYSQNLGGLMSLNGLWMGVLSNRYATALESLNKMPQSTGRERRAHGAAAADILRLGVLIEAGFVQTAYTYHQMNIDFRRFVYLDRLEAVLWGHFIQADGDPDYPGMKDQWLWPYVAQAIRVLADEERFLAAYLRASGVDAKFLRALRESMGPEDVGLIHIADRLLAWSELENLDDAARGRALAVQFSVLPVQKRMMDSQTQLLKIAFDQWVREGVLIRRDGLYVPNPQRPHELEKRLSDPANLSVPPSIPYQADRWTSPIPTPRRHRLALRAA